MQNLKTKPVHISGVIKEAFENIEHIRSKNPSKDDIVSAWHKAAGAKAARHTRAAGIKDNALLVNVDSTAWIYQLRLKEQELLKKICRLLGKQQIKKIRLRAGEVEEK